MAQGKAKKHPLDIKNQIGNDFVFLYLQLIGYPENEPGEILVSDLKRYQFEKLDDVNLCKMLLCLEQDGALKIKETDEGKNSILKITEKTIKFIQSALDIYIERFIADKLIPFREPPYPFKKQKAIFLNKIENDIKDCEGVLNFSDADPEFAERFCFFECALALKKQGHIKIKRIYNDRDSQNKAFYRLAFAVTNKNLKEIGARKEKRTLTLRCFTRGTIGYFQIKKDSAERYIGYKNSREYLLIKYLVHKGQHVKVDYHKAFEAIKDGTGYASSKYAKEMDRILENAIKKLQKKNKDGTPKIKPFKIRMDKNNEKIWLE